MQRVDERDIKEVGKGERFEMPFVDEGDLLSQINLYYEEGGSLELLLRSPYTWAESFVIKAPSPFFAYVFKASFLQGFVEHASHPMVNTLIHKELNRSYPEEYESYKQSLNTRFPQTGSKRRHAAKSIERLLEIAGEGLLITICRKRIFDSGIDILLKYEPQDFEIINYLIIELNLNAKRFSGLAGMLLRYKKGEGKSLAQVLDEDGIGEILKSDKQGRQKLSEIMLQLERGLYPSLHKKHENFLAAKGKIECKSITAETDANYESGELTVKVKCASEQEFDEALDYMSKDRKTFLRLINSV